MALWLWLILTLIVVPPAAVSLHALIWSEQGLGWITGIAFSFVGLVTPVACINTLFRRVLFYEHCIVTRGFFRKTRYVEYSTVKFVARDQALTIYLKDGPSIHIPKLEGDFDRIEEILAARRPATVATHVLG